MDSDPLLEAAAQVDLALAGPRTAPGWRWGTGAPSLGAAEGEGDDEGGVPLQLAFTALPDPVDTFERAVRDASAAAHEQREAEATAWDARTSRAAAAIQRECRRKQRARCRAANARKREAAATRIQALARGHNARVRRAKARRACMRIQARARGIAGRTRAAVAREWQRRMAGAAVRLQAVVRGRQARASVPVRLASSLTPEPSPSFVWRLFIAAGSHERCVCDAPLAVRLLGPEAAAAPDRPGREGPVLLPPARFRPGTGVWFEVPRARGPRAARLAAVHLEVQPTGARASLEIDRTVVVDEVSHASASLPQGADPPTGGPAAPPARPQGRSQHWRTGPEPAHRTVGAAAAHRCPYGQVLRATRPQGGPDLSHAITAG
mmetsp:Transcript_9668/g.32766  ORF Transcript_9668/g.32766 Transcript_9668/m.32766 type:complete len:379 (-) Transcript_9668:811-1947(-)